jgi:hypothetical protein
MSTRLKTLFFLLSIVVSANAVGGNSRIDSLRSNASDPAHGMSDSDRDPIMATYIAGDTTTQERDKALRLDNEVREGNLMIANLNELTYLKLPVGIQKQIGPIEYTIIFSSLESTPAGSFLEAYFMFEIPNTGDKIAFRGSKIPFSNTKGFSGRGRLELIGDYHLVLNSSTLLTLVGKGKSFVEFDCDGFAGMGLEANIEFSRDMIVPEDSEGNILPAPQRVQTKFLTQIQNWNDILLNINVPPFQVKGLKDVSFSIQNASLDWSDLMNPPGAEFPTDYVSPFFQSGQNSLWQGIYIQRVDVRLPKSFSRKGSNERVAIGVENMLLDGQGFTGKVFAENILSSGDMNGWEFTIDKVSLDLIVNQVRGFEVDGQITVPRLKTVEDKPAKFAYKAHKGADGNFLFAITVEENLKLPLFGADLKLYHGSGVTVIERNNKFFPTAELNGELSIKAAKVKFDKISFQGLRISTEEPKLDIQYVGFGDSGDQKVSNFPVVINGISVRKSGGGIGLGVDLTVNISGSPSEGGFGGGGEVIVWGKQETIELKNAEGVIVGSDTDWNFDKIEIGSININASKPNAFTLSGTIQFFEGDAVYGDGFHGKISGSLNKISGLTVQALFGTTGEFRYWYADALVELPASVPIIPGVLFANSFGGGFYSKMKQTDQKPASNVVLQQQKTAVFYVPDKNSMGIKAIMGIESIKKEAMSGIVMLELMMNRHGGINSVSLSGNAEFMSFTKLAESQLNDLAGGAASGKLTEKLAGFAGGQVRGSVYLMFDNVNDVFHGNMEVFINVAGGLVKGVGPNSRAGWAVLHFEKSDWYILIGTPDDPVGLEVAKIFQSKSYFMLGKNLPGSPPPPSQVTEILGNVNLDYMRDMNALQSGAGFAFGLHFIVDTGDLKFLMFYGRFAAGTGIDFMLKDYGATAHCAGSSGPMGINGWYANGQAYAFVMGKIGIKVKLKFYKGNFDIINVGAAAIMQAKGPNPFWMKGTVSGSYSILGGMVKGKCNFEVEVGTKCVPVGEQNVLADQQMIAEISPAANADKVDVFLNPQVAFNIPIGEVFDITDLENKNHSYRATLGQFEVFDAGQKLDGTVQWNADNNVAVFDAFEILPGEKNLQVKVKLAFEEKKNNAWTKVIFQGAPVEEYREVSFRTDKAPNYIPKSNVLTSYPLDGQVNFFPKEYGKGIIQLDDGQAYLFPATSEWIRKVRMTNVINSAFVESEMEYIASEKRVVFDLPSGFANSTIYDFEVLNIPRQILALDANVSNIETQLESESQNAAVLTTKDIAQDVARLEVKTIYKSRFRTSKYNLFVDKMGGMSVDNTFRHSYGMNIYRLASQVNGDEKFDEFEMGAPTRLIRFAAKLSGNNWYENFAFQLVYAGYPIGGSMVVNNRVTEVLGIPPSLAVGFDTGGIGFVSKISEDQTTAVVPPLTWGRALYDVGIIAFQDFQNLQLQAANIVSRNPQAANDRLRSLIIGNGPIIRYGYYDVSLSYVVPGFNATSSSFVWRLFNPMTDND